MSWSVQFAERLPLLGHRNWILVADSAYPAQVGAMEILATGKEHLGVVQRVLQEVQAAPHVRAHVFLDAELAYLTEALAPGWEETHQRLHALLDPLQPESVLHEELIGRIGAAARDFQVLVLKTTGTVPYSSVFFELDCGYWSAESEAALRERLKSGL
ncbi:MAG: hypothetical protein FJX77_12570 [Armatimonadetes bacterium]|nr:hypothetical protein [Armatimonadota bacterium]